MTDPDIAARAAQLRAEAAALPSAEELRDLAARAVAHGGTRNMTLDEIRSTARRAIDGLAEVTELLRYLAQLDDESAHPESSGGGQ